MRRKTPRGNILQITESSCLWGGRSGQHKREHKQEWSEWLSLIMVVRFGAEVALLGA